MKRVKFLSVFALMAMSVCFVAAQGVTKMNEAGFFREKFTKEKVWDVQRFPANPVAGQDWTISGLKAALDATGNTIAWGTGRYLMFVAEIDNAKSPNSLADDLTKTTARYNVSLKLFESNGTLVKVISKWGNLLGMGDKGFLYEAEGRYGSFFSVTDLKQTSNIKYKPSLARVVKLSETVTGSADSRPSEPSKGRTVVTQNAFSRMNAGLIQKSSSNTKAEIAPNAPVNGKPVVKTLNPPKPNNAFDIFKTKYRADQVWEVQSVETEDNAKVTFKIKGPAVYEHGGGYISINEWGKNNDRYMMFVIQKGLSNFFEIIDDVKNDTETTILSVDMFEANGEPAGRGGYGYSCGKIEDLGPLGFVFWNHTPNSDIRLFFSKTPIKANDIITYTPIKKEVTKLSEIQPGKF